MIEPGMRMPPADASRTVTDEYIKAVNLSRRIITAAQLAQQSLYEMCTGFKEMRDSKLYKELGYSDFGDYCEQETGFKKTQAYSYISIVEKLPTECVQSTERIGMQKLYLLSKISEEERVEIIDNNDLENTSVRELERQIKQLRAERDKASAEKSAAEAESAAREDAVKALEKAKRELENRITELQSDIKELEKRPVETAVEYVEKIPDDYIAVSVMDKAVKEYNEQIEQLENENIEHLRAAQSEKTALENRLAEVQEQLDEAKKVPQAVDTDGVFKAYFENAYQLLNTLVAYVQKHTEYLPKVNKLVDNIKKSLEVSS